jgi:hypothetical protein
MLAMGVIDPAKVTRLALQNAGSIASLILTVDCMIANAPKKQPSAPAMGEQPDTVRNCTSWRLRKRSIGSSTSRASSR